jgi:thiol-disulfide isomerase/thioredoxin
LHENGGKKQAANLARQSHNEAEHACQRPVLRDNSTGRAVNTYRSWRMRRWACVFLLCAAANSAEAISLADINGAEHKLLDGKPTVFVFILHDCPIANAFAPEISRICETYEKKGVAFYVVHVEQDLNIDDAKKHAKDFGYKCPVFIDTKHELVKRAQATVSPEGAVFAADGTLKYHGRINDLYVDLGKKRQFVTRNDLRDAIDAVLDGKPVKDEKTEAIGCVIVGK